MQPISHLREEYVLEEIKDKLTLCEFTPKNKEAVFLNEKYEFLLEIINLLSIVNVNSDIIKSKNITSDFEDNRYAIILDRAGLKKICDGIFTCKLPFSKIKDLNLARFRYLFLNEFKKTCDLGVDSQGMMVASCGAAEIYFKNLTKSLEKKTEENIINFFVEHGCSTDNLDEGRIRITLNEEAWVKICKRLSFGEYPNYLMLLNKNEEESSGFKCNILFTDAVYENWKLNTCLRDNFVGILKKTCNIDADKAIVVTAVIDTKKCKGAIDSKECTINIKFSHVLGHPINAQSAINIKNFFKEFGCYSLAESERLEFAINETTWTEICKRTSFGS